MTAYTSAKQQSAYRPLNRRNTIYLIVFGICLFLFEIFSYSSSYEALNRLTGMTLWAKLIAFAVCAIDFAGIARFMMGDTEQDNSMAMLFGAWVLTAICDTALTWIVISDSMFARQNHVLITGGILSLNTWLVTIPVAISILIWLIQILLVTQFEMAIRRLHRGS